MPSVGHAEAAESLAALAAADAAMPNADMTAALPPLDPPRSLINMTTQELAAAPAGTTAAATGDRLAVLRQLGVSVALRSALHVVGDPSTPLSSDHKNRFAERYLHTRIVVDRHTAGAVLYEAFTQPKILILRDLPGSVAPAYPTVSSLLLNPPCDRAILSSLILWHCIHHLCILCLFDLIWKFPDLTVSL